MALARSLLLLIFMALLPAGGSADQSDLRLPGLFDELQQAATAKQAALIEQQIWDIWQTAPSSELQGLMQAGMQAMNRADLLLALNIFDQMIALAPDYAEGWNKRATVYYLLRNWPESLADIAETLKREPRHFGAIAGRGLVHIQGNRLREAARAYEQVLKISPQNPGSRSHLDAIRDALGERDI
uniref:tetratricopeptide repeat protein n=1 Tax=Pararhizobium sp. IMCC3301 TaxID=3067904 RepID=UPI0027413097|nr:hypothetical protein [Pararhizobium sp. IMCC3301]